MQSRDCCIRLLAQHISMRESNPKYISEEAYDEIHEMLPPEIIYFLSDKKNSDTNGNVDYDATVDFLTKIKQKDYENFLYSLISYDHRYYSIEAISEVMVERMSSSDLVKFSYKTDDPGVCQQTLKIYKDVCIKKYKNLKEFSSDVVVGYFENKLKLSEKKLKEIEESLLRFNQENNIINFDEQSKAMAIIKEDMDVAYNKSLAELAGSEASAKRLEKKMAIQLLIQDKNNAIVENKKKLGALNYRIGMFIAKSFEDSVSSENLKLKQS